MKKLNLNFYIEPDPTGNNNSGGGGGTSSPKLKKESICKRFWNWLKNLFKSKKSNISNKTGGGNQSGDPLPEQQ